MRIEAALAAASDAYDFLGLGGIRTTSVEYGHDSITIEAESVEPRYLTCPPRSPAPCCRVCSTLKEQTNAKEPFHR